MKQKILAAALLGAFAVAAHAQSSVTVFGVLDVNARYVKNGSNKQFQEGTDGINSNRLGFRGVEDLGNGLKAGFWLEAALFPDTGTTQTRFWHRRATVSLEGGFGEVRLGRDFTPTYTGISDFDPFGDNGVGKFSNLFTGTTQSLLNTATDTNTRSDNEVQYFLPKNIGGVYGNFAVAPGEGNVAGKRYYGGRIGYAAGPLNVSGALGETLANGAKDQYKVGALAASYDLGVVKLMGYLAQAKFLDRKQDLYSFGVSAPVGQGVIRGSYVHANFKGGASALPLPVAGSAYNDADDADQLAVGYIHNLSKRTALYATGSYIKNKGAQKFVVASGPAIAAGEKSKGLELGVRHSF